VRLLTDTIAGPVSASDAAKLTGLTLAGARKALNRLVTTGFVQRVGGRHSPLYGLSENEPITMMLRDLFKCESERYQSFLSRLKGALGELSEIRVAWIDSPPNEPGKPFHIGVLSDARSLTYLREQIRQRVAGVEKEYDVVIEIHTFSAADAPELDWARTEILAGYVKPDRSVPGQIDGNRAARLSLEICKLLHEDSGLLRRAMKHLDVLLKEDQGSASHDLREWRDILSHYSRQRICDFMVSDTPRAQRLQRSSPFFAVLSADERDKLLNELEAK